jgi:hypothetical protein
VGLTWAFCFPFALAGMVVVSFFLFAFFSLPWLVAPSPPFFERGVIVGIFMSEPFELEESISTSLHHSCCPLHHRRARLTLAQEAQSRCRYCPPAECLGGVSEKVLVRLLPYFRHGISLCHFDAFYEVASNTDEPDRGFILETNVENRSIKQT